MKRKRKHKDAKRQRYKNCANHVSPIHSINLKHSTMFKEYKRYTNTLSIILLFVNLTHCNPVPKKQKDKDGIFKAPLHQNDFAKNLKNPCRAKLDQKGQSKSEPVLLISGRENEIRVITGNMKSRLGFVKKHLVSTYQF